MNGSSIVAWSAPMRWLVLVVLVLVRACVSVVVAGAQGDYLHYYSMMGVAAAVRRNSPTAKGKPFEGANHGALLGRYVGLPRSSSRACACPPRGCADGRMYGLHFADVYQTKIN